MPPFLLCNVGEEAGHSCLQGQSIWHVGVFGRADGDDFGVNWSELLAPLTLQLE